MSTRPDVRLAADIGGTFTDIVLERGTERITRKVLTTARRPEEGVLEGTRLYLRRLQATEVWGWPALTTSDRRAYQAIEADARLTVEDVLHLRRAAEKWCKSRLLAPTADVSKRRRRRCAYWRRHWDSQNHRRSQI